ncbi:hypothetical protein RN001_012363 [Aquatica leii]|uniref:Peptidoglycan-recognition protein n=1 Tax=Aquatica leii TaxID=1421715 RepID=A0AAN7S7R0_9COLE|nr:hypothetical protein RN001_012363 [Aquatica leii]
MVKVFLLFLFCIFHQLLCIAGSCPAIVSREQWGARNPEIIDYVVFPLDIVIIQHTATDTCKSTETCKNLVRSIQNYHIDNVNFGDIGYNFLIGGDGKVYEGRGWHKQGAHLIGYNSKSVGIAFIGNFNSVLPTDAAIKAVKDLMACGVELEELTPDYKLFGAKQLSATASPGSELFNRMRNWDHFTE